MHHLSDTVIAMTITFYKKSDDGKVQYYSLHDRQGDFFSPFVLTAIWGSELDSGRVKVYSFSTGKEQDKKLRDIFNQRVRNGYRVLYSFARNKHFKAMIEEFEHAASGS